MPRLSLGLGVNGSSRIAPAAPSGIPVAGTTEVVVTSSNDYIQSGTWTLNGDRRFEGTGDNVLQFYPGGGIWFFRDFADIATVAGSADYIPFSGYTLIYGSGSITVAAAIPVSTTSLLINGGAGGPTNTYTKATGNTDIYPCFYQTGSSDPTVKYTFNHLWRSSTSNGGSSWAEGRLGVATRKQDGGSGESFILGSNCLGETTVSVSPTWVLFFESGDEYGPSMYTYATNPSQDFNNVPTTGWIIHRDLTSVTITAA